MHADNCLPPHIALHAAECHAMWVCGTCAACCTSLMSQHVFRLWLQFSSPHRNSQGMTLLLGYIPHARMQGNIAGSAEHTRLLRGARAAYSGAASAQDATAAQAAPALRIDEILRQPVDPELLEQVWRTLG